MFRKSNDSDAAIYSRLEADLAALHTHNEQFRLAGSLGRSVHFAAAFDDALTEYHLRGEHPLGTKNNLRDIDTIGVHTVPESPFYIDTLAHTDNDQASIIADGDTWWLVSREKNFAEPLHPDVMQPVHGQTIGGIPATTIPAQTHVALTRSRGFMRKKDRLATKLLEKALPHIHVLPHDLYEPFNVLRDIPTPAHTLALRAVYRTLPSRFRITKQS